MRNKKEPWEKELDEKAKLIRVIKRNDRAKGESTSAATVSIYFGQSIDSLTAMAYDVYWDDDENI